MNAVAMKIFEQHTYLNDKGQMITGRREIHSAQVRGVGPSTETYHCKAQVPITDRSSGQQLRLDIGFAVPGESVEEAFAHFDEAFNKATQEAIAEIEKRAIQQQLLAGPTAHEAQKILRARN